MWQSGHHHHHHQHHQQQQQHQHHRHGQHTHDHDDDNHHRHRNLVRLLRRHHQHHHHHQHHQQEHLHYHHHQHGHRQHHCHHLIHHPQHRLKYPHVCQIITTSNMNTTSMTRRCNLLANRTSSNQCCRTCLFHRAAVAWAHGYTKAICTMPHADVVFVLSRRNHLFPICGTCVVTTGTPEMGMLSSRDFPGLDSAADAAKSHEEHMGITTQSFPKNLRPQRSEYTQGIGR